MDRTQAFDQPDPNRTQAMGMPVDLNRTQAVPGLGVPPTRALTMTPVLGDPSPWRTASRARGCSSRSPTLRPPRDAPRSTSAS
jgi:hypothetical protein